MAEGELIPESETGVDSGQEKGFDIRDKTIPLSDIEINFPYSEELIAGSNRGIRFLHLRNPGICSEEIKANAKYLKGVKEKKAEEIIKELERRGNTTNLLVRGLGGFYDENRPPTTGIMNFHEVQNVRENKDNIVNALGYVVESRLIDNAEVTDSDHWKETRQELLKRPVAIMVADQRRSRKIRDDSGYYDWEINPDAVIAIFPFYINDPLVRDISK